MDGIRQAKIGMVALVAAAIVQLWTPAGAAGPKRLMPFLSRNAVVRESLEKVVLVGKAIRPAPTIVMAHVASGPRADFENGQIRKAASVLARYFEKITGAKCPVTEFSSTQNIIGSRIFVGADGDPSAAFPELKHADAHGFVVARKGKDLHIVGASGTGTLYGAWFFLTNYAQLRLVLPGEIGEVYEKRALIEIPANLYVLNPGPDYLLRIWSGTGGFDQTAWLADTPATKRFEYHHNMMRIYPPREFGKTHPEYYPIRFGKRYIPPFNARAHWQPTFSEPAVAERAIAYANEVFTRRPHMMSISLTVNDGGGHSDLDMKRGRDGLRDVYFKYVNAVAKAVHARWSGKYVAFLPYAAVSKPPNFKLEDNVMMFVFSKNGNPKHVLDAWQGKVKHIGVYQWLYGMAYVIPNHWPHAIQDYLRWVRNHGGKAFKGEAYVAWAQGGCKMWVLNNLLWNVDADVDTLLADYCQHAYGKEAAPAMARYFVQAENIYERRRTQTEYNVCRGWRGTYQFNEARPEDFDIMSRALDEANRLVRGERNKQRVDMTARCFRRGRYYWEQYRAFHTFQRLLKTGAEAGAEAMLRAAAAFYEAKEAGDAYRDEYIAPLPDYCVPTSGGPKKVKWWRVSPDFKWGDFDESVAHVAQAVTALKKKTQDVREVAAYWRRVAEKHPVLKPYA